MAGYGKWVAIVGGVLAVIGTWWLTSIYLSAIGGAVAIVGGLMSD